MKNNMTNQFTIEEAIAQYEEAVEKEFVVDGKVNRSYVWTLTKFNMATDVLSSVVVENDDDEEAVELFEKLANTENGVKTVAQDIVDDDYILGDWLNNTDYHEYNEWVMDIVSNVVKLLSKEN